MIISDVISWWYSRGWSWAARQFFVVYIARSTNFFSISDLLKTLFSPFRQDALETRGAPISIKLQVFGGNIISRFFGFFIRTALIVTGLIAMLFTVIMGIIVTLVWPLLPIIPVVSTILVIIKVGV